MVEHALHARSLKFRPLSIAVLESRSAVIAAASEEGTSLKRFQVAHGRAHRALALHGGSARPLGVMAVERPHSSAAPWAVLVAVGISGDNSDSEEASGIAGIMAASLMADGG